MELKNIKVDSFYANQLDMQSFARMLESPSQSYKFYWLEAILTLLPQKDEMTFEEIIFEMFWEAWFTVSQYHLHLGPTIEGKSENYIEHAVHVIEQDLDMKNPLQRELFIELLEKNKDQIKTDIDRLKKYVPYRLLSSYLKAVSGDARIWYQRKWLIAYLEKLNKNIHLPYIIIDGRGANKKLRISPA